LVQDYRHALKDGLGGIADQYELVCMAQLANRKNVGLAYSVQDQQAYLLFAEADQPDTDYTPVWLLDTAKELTLLMRTLVVPDQTSASTTFWAGIKHGPIISYRFKLIEKPNIINF
jgi:hypothetical protein